MPTTAHISTKKITGGFFEEKKQVGKYARHTPYANIKDRKEQYIITIATPGFLREDFSINIVDNSIIIEGRKGRLNMGYNPNNERCEYDFSNWRRTFELPSDGDSSFTQASYLNGELEVHIPKSKTPLIVPNTRIEVY